MLDTQALSIRGLRGTDADFVLALSQQAFGEFSREPGKSTLWMAEHFVTLLAERRAENLGFVVVRVERDALSELTPRETEVLRLVAEGLSNGEIAERLVVSDETVKTHVKHILAKLGAEHRTQAVAIGIRQSLIR